MSIVYLYVITFVLFFYSKDHAHITAWVFIPHALISLFLYFKNNKRNGGMFSTLKEYVDVTKVELLFIPYKNLLNFTCLIIVLDALLWPVIGPIKFFFWIFYRIFRFRMRRVKRAILEGDLVLIPDEDEIAADPFYNFLMREGLYSASMTEDEESEEVVQALMETDDNEGAKEEKIESVNLNERVI